MHKKIYRGGITCEQFLFYEMRTTARLYCENIERDEIFEKIKNDNLFQFPTECTVRQITGACLRRLEMLDSDELIRCLAEAPTAYAKQIALYAMMLDNATVWDFMTQVIGEKYHTQDFSYSSKDLNYFFFKLEDYLPAAQNWSENTVKKIKQVLNKILAECGYLDSVHVECLNPIFCKTKACQTRSVFMCIAMIRRISPK